MKRCAEDCKTPHAPASSVTSVISASRHPAAQRKIGPDKAQGPEIAKTLVLFADFLFFWQSRHARGILRGTALTGQSFSPNGSFQTPFVPDSMFSGRFWPHYIASLNSQHSCCGFSTATMCCCGTATALVWLPHSLCGCHRAYLWLPHRGHVVREARGREAWEAREARAARAKV